MNGTSKLAIGFAAMLMGGMMRPPAQAAAAATNAPGAGAVPFTTPVTDPDAEWEATGQRLTSGAEGTLDGPYEDSMSKPATWGVTFTYNNARLGRLFTAAGSAVGYLDGPLSRARFLGCDYSSRGLSCGSLDGRYLYITEPKARNALRRIDWAKQEVTTLLPDTKGIKGLVTGKDSLFAFLADGSPAMIVLDQEGREKKRIALKMEGALGEWGCALAIDEARDRIYASRSYNARLPWYIWYWDMQDGAFHGLVPMPPKGAKTHTTGPFEGMRLYQELYISWVPGDAEKRYLFANVTDTKMPFLFDLVDREARMLAKGKDGKVRWFGKGAIGGGLYEHAGVQWLPGGDFAHGTGGGGPTLLYRRIK